MRKVVLTLAALAAFGVAVPVVTSTPSEARDVVVIKHKKYRHGHWDRGHHYGWSRGRHYGWRNHHHHHGAKVVIR